EPRALDIAERHGPDSLRGLDEHRILREPLQDALEAARVVDRIRQPDLGFLTAEALEVLALAQRTVEPRRGNLEALEVDVLDGEEPRELTADARAILDVHALGLVDEDPHVATLGRAFPVDQLVAHRGHGLFQQFAQVHRVGTNSAAKKKWAASSPF